ncbi:hypothetical protein SK128_021450, partial [Halocaridina rubra]
MAERIIALCQTKDEQQQWVEVLNQQSRLARTANFTSHKPSLTSPPVPPAHVSGYVYNTRASLPYGSPLCSCCLCGLPYLPELQNEDFVKDSYFISEEQRGQWVLKEGYCKCKVTYRSPNLNPPELPQQKMYKGCPYAILTKYFSNMYRRKVITKKLLRYLSGDKYDESISMLQTVKLRRHKTECSIQTGYSSGDESLDNEENRPCASSKKMDCHESSVISESSSEGPCWTSLNLTKTSNLDASIHSSDIQHLSPLSKGIGNLEKWRYDQCRESRHLSSSEESIASSDGSNPYGYVRYYNPDDSKLEYSLAREKASQSLPCTKLYNKDSDDVQLTLKNSSCDEPFYSYSYIPLKSTGVPSVFYDPSVEVNNTVENKKDSLNYRSDNEIKCTFSSENVSCKYSLSNARALSHIPFRKDSISDGVTTAISKTKFIHSAVLTIPAPPIVLPNVIPSIVSDDLSDCTPNICNRTIYGTSTSSDDIAVLDKSSCDLEKSSKIFHFKSCPEAAYYVSSCSGDEMANDFDYYESQRKHLFVSKNLSHSEPNIYQKYPPRKNEKENLQFSSHYVQFVHDVENQAKVCSCESYSYRSSDSGLADIVHHLEHCPLRGETPGMGRGSGMSHWSRSSQLSTAPKSMQHDSACHIYHLTPDCGADGDSLLLTPLVSPLTSNPVSTAADSLTSLYENVALHQSSLTKHLPYVMWSEINKGESLFRSGLYAHWWMKASVCPKALLLDKTKKDFLRFRDDKKPKIPPKPKFMKPSYHMRRGGTKGGIIKPLARSTATQTNFGRHQCELLQVTPFLKADLNSCTNSLLSYGYHCESNSKNLSYLSPQSSQSVSRDKSFESQSSLLSQATVIPKLKCTAVSTAMTSQEQLCVPNKQWLTAGKAFSSGSQESSGTSINSCFELSSLHSFKECCHKNGNPPHVRDSSEGLDVDFNQRASSQSLCTDADISRTFRSSFYFKLQPFQHPSYSKIASIGVADAAEKMGVRKPCIPPKPHYLLSRPLQRSKSLPKLQSSVSTHRKSK